MDAILAFSKAATGACAKRPSAPCTASITSGANTLAATLSGAIKANVSYARVRRYDSALQAALAPDDIPTSVYHNLISTVRERLPVLHRYLRLRKKLLGLEELRMWDLYVPMVAAADKPVRYEEAQLLVQEAAQPLGQRYLEVLAQGFKERWVDVMENEGKTSGAFSDGSYVHSALHPNELAERPASHLYARP